MFSIQSLFSVPQSDKYPKWKEISKTGKDDTEHNTVMEQMPREECEKCFNKWHESWNHWDQ
jgi:hypothetical protein